MQEIETILGYEFKSKELLERSLSHSSFNSQLNYERLEFLGDKVLGLVITEIIFEIYPKEDQGRLSKRRAALVCGKTLADIALDLGIGQYILMSDNEEKDFGRTKESTLEDCLEALIGAMYVDSNRDIEIIREFIKKHWGQRIKHMTTAPRDAKTELQEYTQSKALGLPIYKTVAEDGASHNPTFTVEVTATGIGSYIATGTSKKRAEQEAAQRLLDNLKASLED